MQITKHWLIRMICSVLAVPFSLASAQDLPKPPQEVKKTINSDDITGVLVNLKIDGVPSLFALLAADGSINRFGTGAVNNTETGMFIGITDPKLFESVRSGITRDLLKWVGARADPNPRGKVCELVVGFMLANREEHAIFFKYGSESIGPPPEVSRFVIAVVEATNPWYEDFKATAAKQKQ